MASKRCTHSWGLAPAVLLIVIFVATEDAGAQDEMNGGIWKRRKYLEYMVSPCKVNFTYFDDWAFCSHNLTSARQQCREYDGDLASIPDMETLTWLQNTGMLPPPVPSSECTVDDHFYSLFWVGLSMPQDGECESCLCPGNWEPECRACRTGWTWDDGSDYNDWAMNNWYEGFPRERIFNNTHVRLSGCAEYQWLNSWYDKSYFVARFICQRVYSVSRPFITNGTLDVFNVTEMLDLLGLPAVASAPTNVTEVGDDN